MPVYDDALTLRDARRAYFDANDFGADGGYGGRWVELAMGPLRFGFPATSGWDLALFALWTVVTLVLDVMGLALMASPVIALAWWLS